MCLVMLRLPIGDHKTTGHIVRTGIRAKSALERAPMDFLHYLDQQGVHVGAHRYVNLLQKCTKSRNFVDGRQVHAHIIQHGLQQNVQVVNALLNMYVNTGTMAVARQIFDTLLSKDVICWTTMIMGYTKHGESEEAFRMFHQMQEEGVKPNTVTFISILKACTSPSYLERGKHLHSLIIEAGLGLDARMGTVLVTMYGKCGSINDARQLFDKLLVRDVFTWTSMIGGYVEHGLVEEAFHVFHQMQQEGVLPDKVTFINILNACASPAALELGKQLHIHAMEAGFDSDVHVGTALVSMYARCRSIQDAIQVFDKLRRRNVVSWNAMIAAYAEHHQGGEAFKVFLQMQQEGMKPNKITYMSLLNACTVSETIEQGKQVHAQITRAGFESDVCVGSALISMYVRCGSINDARHVFDKLQIRNVITWTAMIRGYAEHGTCEEAFQMYWQMQQEGVKPNEITLISILNACASPADLELGKQLHVHIRNAGYDSDVRLRNALITMYAKCEGHKEAIDVFLLMLSEGVNPDKITYICLFRACGNGAALTEGKRLHCHALQAGFGADVSVRNSLIDMYAKCGSLACARQVFDETAERDVVSWNVMIAGLAQHGRGKDALELFEQMKQEGFMPNSVTFVGLLSTCSHAGLVDEGCEFFLSMCGDYSLIPAARHYGCMVDLLGRAGQLDDAEEIINKMSFDADSSIWNTVLSACRIHDNVQLAELAANCALKLEGQNASVYVLLSHIYAATGMWDNVAKLGKLMKDRVVRKEPGCSWIEVNGKVHAFVADDRTHAETEEIYAELDELTRQIKEGEYVPDTHHVMHEFEEQQNK
jgi:pentatricopeptide repeat protein